MEELKPCPFCGGEAAQRDFTEPFVNGWVGCQKCHCFINWVKGGKPEAVAVWNRAADIMWKHMNLSQKIFMESESPDGSRSGLCEKESGTDVR